VPGYWPTLQFHSLAKPVSRRTAFTGSPLISGASTKLNCPRWRLYVKVVRIHLSLSDLMTLRQSGSLATCPFQGTYGPSASQIFCDSGTAPVFQTAFDLFTTVGPDIRFDALLNAASDP
jgi:hypothetical protein